jgi:hypothetical protein
MATKRKKKLPFGGKKAAPFVKGGGKVTKGATSVAGVKTNANFGARMAAARAKKRGK